MFRNKLATIKEIDEKENVDTINKPEEHTKSGRNSASPAAFNKLVKTMFKHPSKTFIKAVYDYDDFVLVKPTAMRVK